MSIKVLANVGTMKWLLGLNYPLLIVKLSFPCQVINMKTARDFERGINYSSVLQTPGEQPEY